jgi:DNA-nicking Smr family endonuclease
MKLPRGLSADEAAAWARVAATVEPLRKIPPRPVPAKAGREGDRPRTRSGGGGGDSPPGATKQDQRPASPPLRQPPLARRLPPPRSGEEAHLAGLDSTWERKLAKGTLAPDFTLDLHGHTLGAAHARLDQGLVQARALGARVVLVIAGKSRPVDAADRGERRGAIRAQVLDWLAAGAHGSSIAAIRKAHRRHGGDGALYLVLRKGR